MGIVVENIRIKDEFRPTESTNWLLANIGEKVTIEIDFRVEEIFITGAEAEVDRIILNASPYVLGTNNIQDVVYCEQVAAFDNFKNGDLIQFHFTLAPPISTDTFEIYEIINDQSFRVKTVGGVAGDIDWSAAGIPSNFVFAQDGYVALATPMQGIKYFYNFIENEAGTNYNSLTTGEEQRLVIDSADATNLVSQPMSFLGSKDYQIGSSSIVGRGISGGAQLFTITHETFLTPLFLANQYDDLVARTKPSYYEAGDCLKYILNITAGRTLNDPNTIQDIQFDELEGNTGWFNENYNGGNTNYYIDSYTLTRVADGNTLDAIELADITEAVVRIKNTVDSPFSNNNTDFTANLTYLPSEESFYTNNGNTYIENFLFDRAFNTVGAGIVNGDNFGTDEQMISLVSATFVDAQTIDVTVRFDISTIAQATLSSRDLRRYAFWITTQNHTINRNNADKVALLVDVNEFFVELFQTDLITNNTLFIQHPYTDVADGVATPDVFLVDDVVARSDFNIDFTDRESDGIKILNISNQILVNNPSFPDIILENETIDLSSAPLENGLVPFFDVEQNRIFKIPNEIRKIIEVKRNASLDAGNVYNWFVNYPFMHRWEYWESIGSLNFLPTGIFDTNEPNDGLNHNWHRYTTITDWTIYYRLRFTIEQNGEIFTQTFDSPYNSFTFNSNAQWGNESIIAYDVDSGSPLANGADKLIQGYTDTRIVASFEKLTGDIPVIDDVEIVLWIEVKEQGGIVDIRRISSVYEVSDNTWWKSTDSSNKVVKNKVGTVYTGEALIDFTKLPDEQEFTIYARLYDKSVGTIENAKLLESGDLKLLENLDNKILD